MGQRQMIRIDKAILDTNGVICDNISQLSSSDRGLLSQNILGHIRNFVEYIAVKAYSNGQDVNPNDYNLNVAALKDMQRRGELRFLYRFHEMLQKSVSHYTVDKDGSERLMLKYYEHLLKIKLYLKQTFNLDVLENISDFPLNTDTELLDYYKKISERIDTPSSHSCPVTYNDRYYVQKVKPFFVNQKIYYEVTFTAANANASKFDRVIAFTHHEIVDNYKMNNRIIKWQYSNNRCDRLSNLYLNYGCIPFDRMPYCTSLLQHNPRIYDLFESIPASDHEHELFARYIKNNTEIDGHLFTPRSEIEGFEGIDDLIREYNSSLYYKHNGRKIEEYKNHLYIKSYVKDSTEIIEKLQELASSGVSQYTSSVDSWMARESYTIDDDGKKEALRQMFSNSHVALIYGSAGTGKSTLIKHISNFWADKDKIFLANTHPAVDNMRRKVTAGNSEYNTIAKFLSKWNNNTDCDVLFIDECSTVSNDDMRGVLEKANFKLLVLVGDIYQIESIYFGNWFSIAQNFVPKTSIFELTHPYRTTSSDLLTVWDRVRKLDDAILEPLVKNGYVARLDESIFEHSEEDEIILCLNYDGLYGINNINRFLQNSNPNEGVVWGINTYKVGDPILFNESNIFSPLIHNNSKGKIFDIHPGEQEIQFDIELEESINEIDAWEYDFELIGESEAGKSIISFTVSKHRSTDEDDEDNNSTVVPFQVAYAVSIHKAQGLEYDSVKIVITNETEERITHNIFYTAITRAKNKLKIYWSPETEQSVLERLEVKSSQKDAHLLSQLSSLTMAN